MSPRTHYWIIHWLRVVLWPLPVMTLFQGAGCHPGLGAPREDSSFMIRLLSVSTWIPRLWNMRAIRRLAGTLYCSFCGKSQHEVRKLIAGPTVFICDECVKLCMDIIGEKNKSSES